MRRDYWLSEAGWPLAVNRTAAGEKAILGGKIDKLRKNAKGTGK
jgi:hypothetical protein